MKWIFIALIAFASFSALATYGADNPKQKRIYACFTVLMWIIVFVLANVLL